MSPAICYKLYYSSIHDSGYLQAIYNGRWIFLFFFQLFQFLEIWLSNCFKFLHRKWNFIVKCAVVGINRQSATRLFHRLNVLKHSQGVRFMKETRTNDSHNTIVSLLARLTFSIFVPSPSNLSSPQCGH